MATDWKYYWWGSDKREVILVFFVSKCCSKWRTYEIKSVSCLTLRVYELKQIWMEWLHRGKQPLNAYTVDQSSSTPNFLVNNNLFDMVWGLFLSIRLTGRHHREEEALQQINTSGPNLSGAAVSWHLTIYSKNTFETKTSQFWKRVLVRFSLIVFFYFVVDVYFCTLIHFQSETLGNEKWAEPAHSKPILKV